MSQNIGQILVERSISLMFFSSTYQIVQTVQTVPIKWMIWNIQINSISTFSSIFKLFSCRRMLLICSTLQESMQNFLFEKNMKQSKKIPTNTFFSSFKTRKVFSIRSKYEWQNNRQLSEEKERKKNIANRAKNNEQKTIKKCIFLQQ